MKHFTQMKLHDFLAKVYVGPFKNHKKLIKSTGLGFAENRGFFNADASTESDCSFL